MGDGVVDPLVCDLLEWVGPTGRPYDEVMEAWRSTCPRLTVWEDACRSGLVAVRPDPPRLVVVTELGRDHLARRAQGAAAAP